MPAGAIARFPCKYGPADGGRPLDNASRSAPIFKAEGVSVDAQVDKASAEVPGQNIRNGCVAKPALSQEDASPLEATTEGLAPCNRILGGFK
jgi:hypothetical protein